MCFPDIKEDLLWASRTELITQAYIATCSVTCAENKLLVPAILI